MKAFVYMLLMIMVFLFAAGHAQAQCKCKQPAYKDEIDYVTSYLACLDECLNAQMQQIRSQINAFDQRILDLEAEINRLHQRINRLEIETTSPKEKNQN